MEKEAASPKTKKNHQSLPHSLKPKSVTWKKKPLVEKQKIHQSQTPTALNKGTNVKKEASSRKKKHPSKPEPKGLKPKAVNEKNKPQVENKKKIHQSLTPTALNQRQ